MYVVRRHGSRSIERIQYEMEDVFRSLMASGRPAQASVSGGSVPAWRPAIEVYETDNELVVLAELAGLTEHQIEVVIDDTVMTISGERLPVRQEQCGTIHTMGILYGPFAADIYLPFPVDEDRVEATYEAGILQVRLPRVSATRVAINSGSQSATS